MNESLEIILSLYNYALPQELIAQSPTHPRDSARLLIYDRKTGATSFSTFADICDYLPKNAVLVFNKTKVFPAKMQLRKDTGGNISALYIGVGAPWYGAPVIRTLAKGRITSGDRLDWEDSHFFEVISRDGKFAMLKPSFPINELLYGRHGMAPLLEQFGETPLPPYIKHSPLNEAQRRQEYQTVFAREDGSVAAPTAGLHFTKELITKIAQSGRSIASVTLHVGLGTFAPLTEEHWQKQQLHEEWYDIDENTTQFLRDAKKAGRPIVAVGTTTARTLESAFPMSVGAPCHGAPTRLCGMTNIFLHPEHPPRFIDGLITNFHVPRSSLMMLVAALTGREKLLELYKRAMDEQCRFFSFGDGMMIL